MELARSAQRLFERQEAREKRRLLNFMVSNCSWKGGELTTTLHLPFDLLANTAMSAVVSSGADSTITRKSEIWLGREDSNLRMTESKSVALPLGDAPS